MDEKHTQSAVVQLSDTTFELTPGAPVIHKHIPKGRYCLQVHQSLQHGTRVYMHRLGEKELPDPLYGNLGDMRTRIINMYNSVSGSSPFGVLLSGLKGTGKSTLADVTAEEMANNLEFPIIELPTAPVDSNGDISAWLNWLRLVPNRCVFLIDEFDKNWNENHQNQMLGWMSGAGSTQKHMVIIQCNDTQKINQFILGRPGRAWVHYQFTQLDVGFIEQYVHSYVKDKIRADQICMLLLAMEGASFDTMRCVVTEALRVPNKSLKYALSALNVPPLGESQHDFELMLGGKSALPQLQVFTGTPTLLKNIKTEILIPIDPKTGRPPQDQAAAINTYTEAIQELAKEWLKSQGVTTQATVEDKELAAKYVKEHMESRLPYRMLEVTAPVTQEDCVSSDWRTGSYVYEIETKFGPLRMIFKRKEPEPAYEIPF